MRLGLEKFLGALLCAMLLSGCGGETAEKAGPADEAEAATSETSTSGVKEISADGLPTLADPLPRLDGGRIEVAAPEGWKPLPRDNAHLARFIVQKNDANNLPRILVTAADAGALPGPVTSDNVVEFAAAIAAELGEKKGLEEPAKPIIIGDNAFARYVTQARTKSGREVKRQILETVQAGRRYTLTLEVYNQVDKKNRDLAYAVAAGLKFSGSATPAPAAPKEEAPKEDQTETPAEAK